MGLSNMVKEKKNGKMNMKSITIREVCNPSIVVDFKWHDVQCGMPCQLLLSKIDGKDKKYRRQTLGGLFLKIIFFRD